MQVGWEKCRPPSAVACCCKSCMPTNPFSTAMLQGMTVQQFRDTMAVDKKVQDGKLRLILLRGPLGGCVISGDFSVDALNETLESFSAQ